MNGNTRKYRVDKLLPMLRLAAALRNEMISAGFTDNGGAIHSAQRILDILGMCIRYPAITHINNIHKMPDATFSVEALAAYRQGKKVLIEHVAPTRDLTRAVISEISRGASDEELVHFIEVHYDLVLLTPEETIRLNRDNRSTIAPDRLSRVGIQLATNEPAERHLA